MQNKRIRADYFPRPKGSPVYGSSSHTILLFSKFYGKEIDFKDILELNNTKFRWFSDIRRELFRLELAGFIILNDDKTRWRITNKGVKYLYDLAQQRAAVERKINPNLIL
jgi:predicted transcriptional regulator